MSNLKFAAIDVGSNAVRLLVSAVFEAPEGTVFRKLALTRVPVRLGKDVFTSGNISEERARQFLHTMHAFSHLVKVHQPVALRACATSAMRDASNGLQLVEQVRQETGIEIEVINGKTEAEIIYATQLQDYIHVNHSYLYVDVGGGSTEVTLFVGKKVKASRSFNIGTIRIMQGLITPDHWADLKSWVREATGRESSVHVIGSGGNINKIFKLLRKQQGKAIRYDELESFHAYLESYTVEERVRWLELRPDRADVIEPAALIFKRIMKHSKAKKLYVPKFGLSDGIVKQLYDKYKQEKVAQ